MEEVQTEIPRSVSPKHVVVFGNREYILKNVEGLLQKAGFTVSGFLEKEETEDYIRMNPVDALLIGGGVEPHDRQELKDIVQREFSHVKVVEHFGGPATILPEVKAAFS